MPWSNQGGGPWGSGGSKGPWGQGPQSSGPTPPDLEELLQLVPRVVERVQKLPELVDVTTDREQGGLQANVYIDRPAGTSNISTPTPRRPAIIAANAALAPESSTYSGSRIVSASWLTAISNDGTYTGSNRRS